MDAGEMRRANYYDNALSDIEYRSHLDVGCSRGYLLDVSRKRYARVLGVEPNRGYTISGIPTVPSIDEVRGQFDLVTCIHTLEHVGDFVALSNRLVELTAPKGVLIVEVPKDDPAGLSSGLSHPFAFQPQTIKALFPGFELLDFRQLKHPIYVMLKPED
jgi:2-polyprenyl-3-methyl-5-hydroxy-6-metoxy-1,4-benzoquinol methylase